LLGEIYTYKKICPLKLIANSDSYGRGMDFLTHQCTLSLVVKAYKCGDKELPKYEIREKRGEGVASVGVWTRWQKISLSMLPIYS
jgi:hypothetical protein